MYRILAACLVVLSASVSAATAAPKTLECERSYKRDDGSDRISGWYRMQFDPETQVFRFALSTREAPAFDPADRWDVAFVSRNGLRVVAILRKEVEAESIVSPVRVVDVDFSVSKFRTEGFGSMIDFDDLVPLPSKLTCRRLD
ncbi:hypothetical protein NS365_05615 [Aureimonas ureilytica]|uniref:Uncharacterized protein n=1 Tax=Aureimonas ureilytica TaxID=401562 RepID=A0A175RT42_9HYPH|nr:hypothetical protein [Aureimonas ureilytica]KTR06910.1 hypothetical protein NS365_05615 [Aureimonas ureilytica]